MTQEAIGFDWQTTEDEYGQCALQHALLLLGIPLTKRDVNAATRVTRWKLARAGTDQDSIIKAIRSCGLTDEVVWTKSEQSARRRFDALLDRGSPIIISAEDGEHWGVLAGRQGSKYVWIDSNDDDLIGAWPWADVREWMCADPDEAEADDPPYYGIGVTPKASSALAHSLVPRITEARNLLADADLCEYWGFYLEDLLMIFDSPATGEAITAEAFFKLQEKTVIDAATIHYAYSDRRQLRWEAACYRKVAMSHNLTLSPQQVIPAVASLSAALAYIASLYE